MIVGAERGEHVAQMILDHLRNTSRVSHRRLRVRASLHQDLYVVEDAVEVELERVVPGTAAVAERWFGTAASG